MLNFRLFSSLLIIALTACQTHNSEVNYEKILWIPLTESISYYCHKKSDVGLKDGDSIRIEFVGIIEDEKITTQSEEGFKDLTISLADTIELYNLNPIWSKLTANSEVYIQIDPSFEYSRMLSVASRVNLLLHDVPLAQIDTLVNILKEKKYSKRVEFVTKEESAMELKTELGEDFISVLGYNPLSNSIRVKVKNEYLNTDSFREIRADIEDIKIVSKINMTDMEALEKLRMKKNRIFKITTFH